MAVRLRRAVGLSGRRHVPHPVQGDVLTPLQTFTMLSGSRLGASFIVLLTGFLYAVRNRGRNRTNRSAWDVLALSLTAIVYCPGCCSGTGLFAAAARRDQLARVGAICSGWSTTSGDRWRRSSRAWFPTTCGCCCRRGSACCSCRSSCSITCSRRSRRPPSTTDDAPWLRRSRGRCSCWAAWSRR